MAEELWVVIRRAFNGEEGIVAIFTNEGLAMTHRAKMMLVDPKNMKTSNTYTVEKREPDSEVDAEPYYWAYTALHGKSLRSTDLQIKSMLDWLGKTLPESSTSHDPAADSYTFSAYGWDAASAEANLQTMVETWYNMRSAAGITGPDKLAQYLQLKNLVNTWPDFKI